MRYLWRYNTHSLTKWTIFHSLKGSDMAKRKQKGVNGVGQFVSLTFDISDPQEAAALAAAQLLASKHGRRKQAVVAFLSALYEVYETTGKLLSPVEIANAVQGAGPNSTRFMNFTPPPANLQQTSETVQKMLEKERYSTPKRTPRSARNDDEPAVVVTAAKKASAATIAANMTASFGKMGFFD
jgi:hypothetical protein